MENKRFTMAEAIDYEGKLLAVASDESIDREGEILSIDGWDLKEFKKNPTLLWSHSAYDLNIGKAKNIGYKEIDGKKKLVFEPDFHDITDLSRTVHRMFTEGYLKTFSVGFLPSEMDGNKFTKQKLLEISVVNVPANANAEVISMAYELENAYVKSLSNIKETPIEEKEESDEKLKSSNTYINGEATIVVEKKESEVEELKIMISEMRAEIKSLTETAQDNIGRSEQGTPQLRKSRKLINSIKYAAEHLQELIKEND